MKLYCHICGNEIDPPDQDYRFVTDVVTLEVHITWADNGIPHRICETCVRDTIGVAVRALTKKPRGKPKSLAFLDLEYTMPEGLPE